ncbi:hypothetical protein [Microvirga mediterraneensis]|uniref:Uncharacterized protein n=1 Tax=Microvirga mediterraneensis TaxID=2754695 RepID=A0A838BSR9_9HYPH|nr:hypothetical protein [Microvirga mediterraneensis]MBA1158052.1 hypothetical protein [Microvirga mediterraneensis]
MKKIPDTIMEKAVVGDRGIIVFFSGNWSVVPRKRAPFASMQSTKIFRQFSPAVMLFLAWIAAFSASNSHPAPAREYCCCDKPCASKTKSGLAVVLQPASNVSGKIKDTEKRRTADNKQVWKDCSPESEIKKDRARQLTTLIGLSEKFGDSLSNAFAKNIAEGIKTDISHVIGRVFLTCFALNALQRISLL